jgi:hypothetical protein
MPSYDRGDPPQSTADVLRFLREELTRLEAYTHAPRTDGAWDDLRFPAQAIDRPGPTASPTWDTTNIGQGFADNAVNELQFIGQMPHAWREGTNIRPHIHWEAGTGFTPGTAVVWALSLRWRNNRETTSAMTIYTITTTVTHTLALMISPFPELDGTGKDISSVLDMQIARLATSTGDSMSAVAILKEFDIHYLTDSFGSDKEYIK